jgi:hypothetical protein
MRGRRSDGRRHNRLVSRQNRPDPCPEDTDYGAAAPRSPEAAAVSGASLAAIQKTTSTRKIPARAVGTARRRRLDETAPPAFALSGAMPPELPLTPGAAYRVLGRNPAADEGTELTVGTSICIDAGNALSAAGRRLSLYRHPRGLIVRDPAALGAAALPDRQKPLAASRPSSDQYCI